MGTRWSISFKQTLKRSFKNIWQSTMFRTCKGRHAVNEVNHIVFMCKGNICRSPFAEYSLRTMLPFDEIKIESCGLDVNQQVPCPAKAVEEADELGIDLGRHHARGIDSCDLAGADLIVAMEYAHILWLDRIYPQHTHKTRLLREFAPFPENIICNINDPYGFENNEYRNCFILINKSLRGLVFRMEFSECGN